MANLQKKIQENEALQKTLLENENNKRLQEISKQKEKEDDIRAIEEYTKVLDKQENERKLYFQNIENKANNFLSKISQTVLKEVENKKKLENEMMKDYLLRKEEKEIRLEKERLEKIKCGKREIRSFLDKQVEEKNREKEFQKMLNQEQARIWNKDKEVFSDQMKEISDKIRKMNDYNQNILKVQMEIKKGMNSSKGMMTDQEYLMNRKIIENAHKELNNS